MGEERQQRRGLAIGLLSAGLALSIIGVSYFSQRSRGRAGVPASSSQSNAETGASFNSGNAASTQAGQNTSAGAGKPGGKDSAQAGQEPKTDDPYDYGRTPPVKGDANPQVAAAVDAVKTKTHPERLSTMLRPKEPFNLQRFEQNPQAYLDVVEPGRAHMPHQPGPDVPRIRPAGPTRLKMKQGQSTVLRAQVPPDMPCTYTSYDLGRFENELTSITVVGNGNGVAEARFSAPPGTIADVHILCASPVMSGQLRFVVTVSK